MVYVNLKTIAKTEKDLGNSLKLLEDSINLAKSGSRVQYLNIAVQLRKLFCDNSRKNIDKSLVYKLLPKIMLHQVNGGMNFIKDQISKLQPNSRLLFASTSEISSAEEGISGIFDFTLQRISLQQWLNQGLFYSTPIKGKPGIVTIRELILSVANKEGAHSDDDYDDVLIKSKSSSFFFNKKPEDQHVSYIISLGEYAYKIISNEWKQLNTESTH